ADPVQADRVVALVAFVKRFAGWAGLLALYLAVPNLEWAGGLHRVKPAVFSGDEPHYLLMVNSLIEDGDLQLGPDYERVRQGGAQAGLRFRYADLDHHTILVDPRSGRHELWQRIFNAGWHLASGGYARLQGGFESGAVEVPAHPPAFAAALALLCMPFRKNPLRVEHVAIMAMALCSFLTLAVLFFAARRAGLSEREAAFAVALCGLASPHLAYAQSFFPDTFITLALALALWALAAGRPALVALAIFAATAIKPPFMLVGLAWAALFSWDGKRRDAGLLLATLLPGCVALGVFNFWLARTPVISGSLGFVPADGLDTLRALFVGSKHGLFVWVPWTVAGTIWLLRSPPDFPLLRALAWGAAPVVALTIAQVSDGGYCHGPRYLLPFLPWLALATVAAFRAAPRIARAAILALALAGMVIAVPGALRYRQVFDVPVAAIFRR
ncbi:MAG: hypothetical protein ACM3PC_06095, partial [Deltaproteobacteria bacterium]